MVVKRGLTIVAGKRKNDQILQYRSFVDVINLFWWARVTRA
jgi:hypothetical protein